ncbi:radical SAM protein [Marinifilum sp. D714]|uniref:radical SAM protein n=1 Tax=Marinifilum sp. D714 TaxID=2937523 RepID=UPI0027C86828|nr:radical SAM protein [Marinifilum sp. D714]MDQ2179106.1 radical SAM protein [Marinifilum sp. D714]
MTKERMYKYLFGPIPSRRLGMSLGVDLVPKKVCSIDCVYCEVGRTTQLSVQQEDYIAADKIKEELNHYLQHNQAPDYVTITASGEPTLNANLEEIIAFVKQNEANIPVCVITNGTLLHDKKVREALNKADLILPSLDAATEPVFRKINRPHKEINFEAYIQGMIDFSAEFTGEIWLEVFILPNYNDSKEELLALKEIILKINPDIVQLNTLDRPGTVANLRGATQEELQAVMDLWQLDNVRIIAKAKQSKQTQFRSDTETAIKETISRRPCTVEDLITMLGLCEEEIDRCLANLASLKGFEKVEQERGVFYQIREQ